MVKLQTEMVRIRLPKGIRAKLEIEAEKHHTDMSKLIRRCVKCFIQEHDCLVKKELTKLQKEG
jgi:hypothetical protein